MVYGVPEHKTRERYYRSMDLLMQQTEHIFLIIHRMGKMQHFLLKLNPVLEELLKWFVDKVLIEFER
jgi:hypothetical protein